MYVYFVSFVWTDGSDTREFSNAFLTYGTRITEEILRRMQEEIADKKGGGTVVVLNFQLLQEE